MRKCVICEKRKGKRFCPLKDAMICSQCCGLLQAEGNCPDDCPFLKESKEFAASKKEEREHELAERFKRDFHEEKGETHTLFNTVAKPLNDLFAQKAKEDSYLEDKDILEAVQDLIDDMKAGGRVVLSPEEMKLNRAAGLLPVMKEKLDQIRKDPSFPQYLTLPCLEILRGLIALARSEEDPKAYIKVLLEKEEAAPEEEQVAPVGHPASVDVGAAEEVKQPQEAAGEAEALDLFEDESQEGEREDGNSSSG